MGEKLEHLPHGVAREFRLACPVFEARAEEFDHLVDQRPFSESFLQGGFGQRVQIVVDHHHEEIALVSRVDEQGAVRHICSSCDFARGRRLVPLLAEHFARRLLDAAQLLLLSAFAPSERLGRSASG